MSRSKSSVSNVASYKELGEFWDTHDLSEFWGETKEASFEVAVSSEITYYALDKKLSERLRLEARRRGVAPDTLVNLWVSEKLKEQKA